jgi:hypothetical protein
MRNSSIRGGIVLTVYTAATLTDHEKGLEKNMPILLKENVIESFKG